MADSKRTFNLGTALDAVPEEVWLYLVASHFEVAEILPLRAVSTAWRAMATHDDVWLNKLTVLSLQFPTLSQLDRAGVGTLVGDELGGRSWHDSIDYQGV